VQSDYDVIVIGAGFAGVTAARECSNRGLSALILEGRDRIGGRTHTAALSSGEKVDLGGTYVHWIQPHLWAEVTRYGLEDALVDAGEDVDEVCAPTADGLKWSSFQEHREREKRLLTEFYGPTRRVFPKPYQPLLMKDEVKKFDISLEERLGQMNVSADDDAFLRSLFLCQCGVDLSEGSFLAMARWYALSGYDFEAMDLVLLRSKFKNGTVTLLSVILDDSGAVLRLSTTVTEIEAGRQNVSVKTSDGERFVGSACVVATPSGAWADLKFSPPLPDYRLAPARARSLQTPGNASTKALLRGERRRFYFLPEFGHPIGYLWTVEKRSDDVQMVQVYQGPGMRNAADAAEMTAAIKDLLPHVEVLELVTGTFYGDDPFSRGGFPMYRAGVLSRDEPPVRLARPEGRVVFATGDISQFWNSFIDGAIESGIRAGRHVRDILGGTRRASA
jgi:monoamine oxidase